MSAAFRGFAVCWCIGLMAIPATTDADSPLPPATDYVVCGSTKTHCAFVSVAEGVTVFSVQVEAILYRLPGYHRFAYLSDDGEAFIEVQPLLKSDPEMTEPILTLWIHGVLARVVSVQEVLGRADLVPTASHLAWGDVLGFNGEGTFSVRLANGKTFELHY